MMREPDLPANPVQLSWYQQGCTLAEAGHLIAAVNAFTAAIDRQDELAQAYFQRGVCHYLLRNCHRAEMDLNAAGVLGCRDALLWSRYDFRHNAD